jgi:hypothetical protein
MTTEIREFINSSDSDNIDYMHYAVDIPNPNIASKEWICIEYFETKQGAINFAKETFGADNEGRICLVSSL